MKDVEHLLSAVHFAAERHRDGRREDACQSPYINHAVAVARTLAREAGVEDVRILSAALLHDLLEETQTRPGEIEQRFGAEIRRIVEEVTDDLTLDKASRRREQIRRAPHLSYEAKLIKIADKLCNVLERSRHSASMAPLEDLQEYVDFAAEVVQACRGTHARLESRFDEAVAEARRHLCVGHPPASLAR